MNPVQEARTHNVGTCLPTLQPLDACSAGSCSTEASPLCISMGSGMCVPAWHSTSVPNPYLPSCCAVPLRASTSSAAPSAGRQIAADRSLLQTGEGISQFSQALEDGNDQGCPVLLKSMAYPDFGALSTSRTPCNSSSSAA
jgi:hypothetical protein